MDEARHRALARGLRVLDVISGAGGGMTVTEISHAAGLDKSSASRLVSTLVDLGYLTRLESRRIVLTGRVLNLAKGFHQQHNLSDIARPFLTALRDRVAETVILTVRQGLNTISVDQLDPERPFRMVPHIGNTAPLYGTAAGRAILFMLPVAEQREILTALEGAEVEHPEVRLTTESWARELESSQARGFVWIRRSDDVERIAAAVRDRNGAPLAAVSIYGPKHRMEERIAALGREARQTASSVSRAAYGVRSGEMA